MTVLTARDGYRLWAPHYEQETAVSLLEASAVSELDVETRGRALLDAGCGTARRIADATAALAIGLDLSVDMLLAEGRKVPLTCADVCALPFAASSFDVVWCRLVVGHVRDAAAAYREFARVCRADGNVIVTDFAPEAAAAGHRRTFQDADGVEHVLEHFVRTDDQHAALVHAAGMAIVKQASGAVGPAVRDLYGASGRVDAYRLQIGLPLVRAFHVRRLR
ncbi:MAG: class I SAM-dependent methyltransferase [bacterium]